MDWTFLNFMVRCDIIEVKLDPVLAEVFLKTEIYYVSGRAIIAYKLGIKAFQQWRNAK